MTSSALPLVADKVAISLREMEPRLAERDGYFSCRENQPLRVSTAGSPRSHAGIGRVLICLWLAATPCLAVAAEPSSQRPFFDLGEQRVDYAGPGREIPAPVEIEEVLIGYFGPADPHDPHSGDLWRAAQLAVEEANRGGGYQGKPFRLLPGWSENPWGTGVAQLVRMAYRDRVWAIVGGIDGQSTHLAEQVVAKARLLLLNPAGTDKTVNLANVPWVFSLLPGDHLQAPVLAEEIARRLGEKPLVLVSSDDHDSRGFAGEVNKSLAARRIVPRFHFQCRQGAQHAGEVAARVVESGPGAVVLAASAEDSARLAAALRGRGFQGAIFGGPTMGRRRFVQQAGAAAEGVIFPLLYQPREAPRGFAKTFESRFGEAPDYAAAHTYDAVNMLVAAVRAAGLNRARIRDAVRDLSPRSGTTGTIRWDGLGSNVRKIKLGTIRHGCVVPLPPQQRVSGAAGDS